MAIKALRIGEVAARAGVRLSRASEVLGGKRNDPETLHKLRRVIEAAKMPKEVEA